eukprot:PLAT1219.1.p1 GENE.PLAT1219.1~~PLAT1219.1.p1  ORF type:complete len:565 (-),score=158.45 PLAT1219.1:240-1934(-)
MRVAPDKGLKLADPSVELVEIEEEEEMKDDFDIFDVPTLDGESFYGEPQMPPWVLAIARLFPSYEAKALLPYALMAISIGLGFLLVPMARMSRVAMSDSPAMAITGRVLLRVLNDFFLVFFFTPYMWDEVYPCVLSKRQWRLYGGITTFVLTVSAVLLTVSGGEEQLRLTLKGAPFHFQLGTAIEDTFQVFVHSFLPCLLMLPSIRRCLGWNSYPGLRFVRSVMRYASPTVVVYSAVALCFNSFGINSVLALSPLTMAVWAIALLCDRKVDATRDMFYGIALSFITRGGALGASAILGVLLPATRGVAGGTLITLFLFNLGFSLLRLSWVGVARKLFKGKYDSQAHLLALQIVDDVLGELVFLGSRIDSLTFWLAAVVNSVKQVVRDTALLSNVSERGWRRLRGLPALSAAEETSRFELQWRMLSQNLFSEMTASIILPLLFLFDLGWSAVGFAAPAFTAGLSGEAIAHQLAAFGVLLLMEVVTHRIVKTLLHRRLAKLVRKGMYAPGDGTIVASSGAGRPSFTRRKQQSADAAYWLRKWPVFVALCLYALQDSILRVTALTDV